MRSLYRRCRAFLPVLPLLLALRANAQANLPVYTTQRVNGFQDWSWAIVNYPVTFSGTNCLMVVTTNYSALYLEHDNINTSPYASLDFWINGGSSGGQKAQVVGLLNGNNAGAFSLGTFAANTWQHFTIPLATLGVAKTNNFSGFIIQGTTGNLQPAFYVAAIQLLAAPAPATVHLRADGGNLVRAADTRWFGLNTAVWDDSLDTSVQSNALKQIGCTTLRFPGGSLSDEYHWATNSSGTNSYVWNTSFGNFMHVATNLHQQAFITVNYGTGTSNEAAAWVANANITNHCNFKYWEIGNELYGPWETDSNTPPNDPYTYATRAAGYIQLMKAKDPTIKIGVVAVAGEDSSVNDENHAAVNPVTGQTHYGWTPVMLSTFKSLGIYPDFLIYHYYYEYSPGGTDSTDSDPLLLQVADNPNPSAYSDWASAAQSLRLQLTDYLGAAGSNIELCVTENNSDSGPAEGKQSTGIVNALYLADSFGQLMKTEFNSLIWWDLWNGPDYNGDFDPTLYGWRNYGDLGIMTGTTTFYPAFYAKKLVQNFAGAGDSVVTAASDYILLSDYAVRRTNGALTLLVINKDVTTNFNAQIVLTNFVPAPNAIVQSYGIAQDNATETNAALVLQDIATNTFSGAATNFNYTFPAGTLTLFTFSPCAVKLQSSLVAKGKFALQYQGQANTPYVLQESPDLSHWTPVATNTSVSAAVSITNAVTTTREFWRVIWQP